MSPNDIWKGIFDSELVTTITLPAFLSCLLVSMLLGFVIAFTFSQKAGSTKSFLITLGILPAIVCVVIMMVNGNVGTGVAVAGTFSLVRFRSVPGTAREIGAIFLAMGAGLMTGMGYLAYAVLFTVILCALYFLYTASSFGEKKPSLDRTLTITIPEDLNYTEVFDEPFLSFTTRHTLERVRTTNMGSLFQLTYNLTMKSGTNEKEFLDALRCRNGNLEIAVSPLQNAIQEL